jgi:hypothetical protein
MIEEPTYLTNSGSIRVFASSAAVIEGKDVIVEAYAPLIARGMNLDIEARADSIISILGGTNTVRVAPYLDVQVNGRRFPAVTRSLGKVDVEHARNAKVDVHHNYALTEMMPEGIDPHTSQVEGFFNH